MLNELVERESELENQLIKSGDDVNVRFVHDYTYPLSNREIPGVGIVISHNGIEYYTKMDKVFIHQIGKRIYGDDIGNEYYPVFIKWVDDLNSDPNSLCDHVREVLTKQELVLRFFKGEQNQIF